jgi:hypothetical protein
LWLAEGRQLRANIEEVEEKEEEKEEEVEREG